MRLLRVFVPLALIALCLWLADGRAVLARLSGLSVGWFLGTVVLLNAVTLLSALRWKLTATALNLPLSAGEAVREYYLAQFVNQTLPGGVLGDAARAMRSRKGGPMRRAAQAVVLERASGQAGMALVAVLGLMLFVVAPQNVLPAASALPAIAWLPQGVLVALLIGAVPLALGSAGGREEGWRRAVREALLRRWPVQTALSVLVALLTVAAFALAARATGSALVPTTALLIVPLILTAMLLPASVAGWGWREGAAASLFTMAGLGAEAGIAASIAFGIAMLLSALPGAFFLQRTAQQAPRETAEIASPTE
ncbi:lysylphosphatidylglycerol synthase transmembrane domain-containing protein [Salipiger bermudensis]|uniref:lysylphosphatidylglycerol synthase transmembrane domain-containing protein n=1 Tax=Salipiger bermudensis TaxID=344736 RepID=UPI0035155275